MCYEIIHGNNKGTRYSPVTLYLFNYLNEYQCVNHSYLGPLFLGQRVGNMEFGIYTYDKKERPNDYGPIGSFVKTRTNIVRSMSHEHRSKSLPLLDESSFMNN